MVATLAGGAPIPGSALALKQFQGDAVQDIAELKAVGPGARFDKQERTVEGPPFEQYFFESGSVAGSSEPDILVPDDSPAAGRWFRHMPGGGVPGTHAASHTDGSDQIAAVTGAVNGLMIAADKAKLDGIEALAEVNVVTSVHGRTGAVIAVANDYTHAQLSAIGVDDHHAQDHRASHISGGGDAFLATDVLEAIVKRIQTTTGPTTLLIGAIADGEFLKRVGTTIVSDVAGGGAVDSVFGRTGAVVAVSGDYDSDEVTNVSGVFGSTVTVALNTLDNDKLNLVGDTMTGTLTTQIILPDGDGTRNQGAAGTPYGTVFANVIQAGTTINFLALKPGNGDSALEIETGKIQIFKNFIPSGDNSLDIGEPARVFKSGFFRTVEIGTGTDTSLSWSTVQTTVSHAILGLDTASRIILVTGRDRVASDYNLAVSTTPVMYFADGGAVLTHWTSMTHNGVNFVIRTNFGSTEITSTLRVSQVRARVASSLILSDATGTSVITIADAGDMDLTPTGDVLIGGIKPVLANGTVSLTAQWNVGDQIISGINALRPDGSSGSKSIGGTGNAWGTVFTRTIRADNTQVLVVADGAATAVITVANAGDLTFSPTGDIITSGDVKPNATGSRSIGTSTLAYVTVFTRGVQSDTASLILRDSGGTSRLEIRTSTMLFRQSLAPFDNGGLDVGNTADGFGRGFFKFLQASNTFDLDLESEDGTVIVSINNTGLSFFAGAPVAKAAVLTTVDATVIDATYGATEEAVINNTRTRLNDLESRLQAYNLLS